MTNSQMQVGRNPTNNSFNNTKEREGPTITRFGTRKEAKGP